MHIFPLSHLPRRVTSLTHGRQRVGSAKVWVVLACLVGAAAATYTLVPEVRERVQQLVSGSGTRSDRADYQTHTVAPVDMTVSVSELGEVESSSNLDVKCQVRGGSTVLWIIPEGTEVTEGDLLVKLDDSKLRQDHTTQKIQFETARSALIQAQQDLEVARIAFREYQEGTFQKEMQLAEANVVIANENLKTARNKLDHAAKMFRKGYITRLQLEGSEFAVQHAELELAAQKTAERVLKEFTRPKMITELKATVDVNEAVMLSKQAAFDLEKEKLEDLARQIAACIVKAPAAGMVIYANERSWRGTDTSQIKEGTVVREQQAIIKLPDLARIQVNTAIHETKIQRIKVGQRAVINIRNRAFEGTVVSVANQPEPTSFFGSGSKKYSTIVELVDYDRKLGLRPGMTADVTIVVQQYEGLTAIPEPGLIQVGSEYFCFVETESGPVKRTVVPGVGNGTLVQIKDGLKAGDQVVLNPRTTIPEAQELAARADAEKAALADKSKRGPGGPGGGRRPGGPPGGSGPAADAPAPPRGPAAQGGPAAPPTATEAAPQPPAEKAAAPAAEPTPTAEKAEVSKTAAAEAPPTRS